MLEVGTIYKKGKAVSFEKKNSKIPISFFFTTNFGMYMYNHGKVHRVLPAKYKTWGITKASSNIWFINFYIGEFGYLGVFEMKDRPQTIRIIESNLSKRMHQMDMIGDDLYITDTQFNRIVIYYDILNAINKGIYNIKHVYLNGRCDSFDDDNHLHINSVFKHGGKVYVLAHNMTQRTGKSSQMYVLNNSLGVVRIDELNISSGHNIYIDDNNFIVNDSIGKSVIVNGKNFKVGGISRGLSVSDSYIIVGSSSFNCDRATREIRMTGNSFIHIFDHSMNRCCKLVVVGHQVYDIRGIDYVDYGMSNYKKNLNKIISIG